jgi:hypothetical protein
VGLYRSWPLLAIGCLPVAPAFAEAPTAIVEDVDSAPSEVETMSYLEPGKTIDLGKDGRLVLSYLNSCVRETIHGGFVVIGREQSDTRFAQVEREKIACDAARMSAAPGRSLDVAGMVLRNSARENNGAPHIAPAQNPEFVLYGSSPLVELNGGGTLVIARLDEHGEYVKVDVEPNQLRQGKFLDFAEEGRSLTAGGVYGVRWRQRLVVFKIDPSARPGKSPILGRLLRLGLVR